MQIKIRESPWNVWIFGEVDRTFKKEKYLDRHDYHLHLEFGEGRTTLDCLRGRLGRDHDVIGEKSMVATWLRHWGTNLDCLRGILGRYYHIIGGRGMVFTWFLDWRMTLDCFWRKIRKRSSCHLRKMYNCLLILRFGMTLDCFLGRLGDIHAIGEGEWGYHKPLNRKGENLDAKKGHNIKKTRGNETSVIF